MNTATFFRHRENDPGHTHQVAVGQSWVSIYSRNSVDLKNPKNKLTPRDIRHAVEQSGGGLFVEAFEESGGRRLKVTRVPRGEFQPPKEFALLAPGRAPGRLEADGDIHQLPAGSHALVPVNEDAAKHLWELIGQLSWLPLDIESLVLNAIRRPSLDARVSKLESKLSGGIGGTSAMDEDNFVARLRQFALSIGGMLMLLTMAILIVNSVLLYRLTPTTPSKEKSDPAVTDTSHTDTTATEITDTTAPATNTGAATTTTTAPSREEKPGVKAARPFLAAVDGQRNNATVQAVFGTSLNSVNDKMSSEQIEVLLQRRDYWWALFKLQSLQLGTSNREGTIASSDSLGSARQIVQTIPDNQLNGNPKRRRMLARLACNLGYDTETNKLFTTGENCTKFDDSDVQKGLPELTPYVKGGLQ